MRKNLPVTANEYHMEDGRPIVSKTDLKGKITYVNPYFVEVSGFSEDELIGQPHNLVRHPDMPPQAFADLWDCLKQGVPWTGMVKNRRKNGDFYWVLANVTPVLEHGRATGYMSIRSKPSRDQIAAADRLYRDLVAGRARYTTIRHGQAVLTNWQGKLQTLRDMTLQRQIALGAVGSCVMFAGISLAAWWSASGAAAGWISAVAALGALLSLLAGLALRARIVQPLRQATLAARALAGGDLTGQLDAARGDEAGQLLRALQQTNVNLQAIIGDVRSNVDTMNAATREIAAGNENLARRTESQAASLEQTASSMEQFSGTVNQNAESTRLASELASRAAQVATRGGDMVVQVGNTMADISQSAKRIADIIGLIDGIAFQTNILALNASVEAARAGEQGRGFAVVASEVRQLAQRSAAAAKEIKGLIEDSARQVALGNQLVLASGENMQAIITAVNGVADIMGEIDQASREQSLGIVQVNQAVSSMDEVTQHNASLVEGAASAANSLHVQASQLARAVAVFNLPRQHRSAVR